MPSESDAPGLLNIKHLLELLNASDVPADIEKSAARLDDMTTSDVATADGKTVEVPPPHYAVESEPAVLSADPELDAAIAGVPADNENKFAAHIVRGMSKLKAG
jgi:hypothetical protein